LFIRLEEEVQEKLRKAKRTIQMCKGKQGYFASAGYYKKQYWIRDTVYSMESLLSHEDVYQVKKQLIHTLSRQRKNGEIPARIIEVPPSISGSLRLLDPRLFYPYTENHDSNLLTTIGLYRYVKFTNDTDLLKQHSDEANKLSSFTKSLLSAEGFLPGADWRDAMRKYAGRSLFCNQVLLFAAERLSGNMDSAIRLKERINSVFWRDDVGYYRDYAEERGDRPVLDSLGHALAILEELVPKSRIEAVVRAFDLASTELGYRNTSPSYPRSECGQKPETYQNSAIWPFVHGYVISALVKAGFEERAREEFDKFTKLFGFNEWYSPTSGAPMGSHDQLFSAALYLRAHDLVSTA